MYADRLPLPSTLLDVMREGRWAAPARGESYRTVFGEPAYGAVFLAADQMRRNVRWIDDIDYDDEFRNLYVGSPGPAPGLEQHFRPPAVVTATARSSGSYRPADHGYVVVAGKLGVVPTPQLIRQVRFEVRPWGDGPDPGRELLPYVDNVSLVELATGFEHAAGYDAPGEYAGIVLDHFDFGDLAAYLTGLPDSAYWAKRGSVALLGCNCGEVGCWPFEAHIGAAGDLVTWRGFAQPHRTQRDYGSFGPFVFRRNQYERAVREAVVAASYR
ncbi:hypothetical protein [Plantactinospora sp. B5E13]|uniref:hypothetical protein n=1 Tax=Plantactinospora sp. B5E13 TaxID=3153758 RepID=UPI00325ECF88